MVIFKAGYHIGTALILVLSFQLYNGWLLLGVIIGSAIMDCDHQYAPMAFIPLWRIVKHRRETHSIFFALVTSGLLTVVHPLMGVGNMIGCLLHLFGDWTTYYGQLDGLPCLWFPFNVIREKDKNIAA